MLVSQEIRRQRQSLSSSIQIQETFIGSESSKTNHFLLSESLDRDYRRVYHTRSVERIITLGYLDTSIIADEM